VKPAKDATVAALVLIAFAVALVVTACASIEGEAAITTEPASTTTTWPVNTVFIDETADGTSVHLNLGDLLVLRLQGNPTTGYSWKFEGEGDPVLQRQGAFSFVPDSDAIGAGGTYQSVSLAVAEGTTFLALNYVAPDDQVDHNYYVDVVVGDATAGSTTTESTAVVASTETTEEPAEEPTEETTGEDPEDDTTTSSESTTTTAGHETIRLDQHDSGATVEMHVGDRLEITVPLHPSSGSTAEPAPAEPDFGDLFDLVSRDDSGTALRMRFLAIAAGRTAFEVNIVDSGHRVKDTWGWKLRVLP
jgi:predicted secreted protein